MVGFIQFLVEVGPIVFFLNLLCLTHNRLAVSFRSSILEDIKGNEFPGLEKLSNLLENNSTSATTSVNNNSDNSTSNNNNNNSTSINSVPTEVAQDDEKPLVMSPEAALRNFFPLELKPLQSGLIQV